MAEPIALVALLLDAGIGWPDRLYARVGHPVGGFACIIGWCERAGNRPEMSAWLRRLAGMATLLCLLVVAIGFGSALAQLCRGLLGSWAWLAIAALAWPGLAQRSLHDHVLAVERPLASGDIGAARKAVGRIVGRDTASLDEAGIARAGMESLAESFCDGVVAPLFWLLVAGLPGIWAYKAVNTADSLIGHKEPRWRAFGWAAARTDDLLNLVPARLAGMILCVAGGGGWRVLWRDAGKHASPNAGWPEAALAGALRVRLAGPIAYDGVMQMKPWIGDGGGVATAPDLGRALAAYRRACLVSWLIAGGVAWAR